MNTSNTPARWMAQRSIHMKLMSALLALALVPLTIVAVVAYQTSQDILKDNASAKLEELAAQTIDKIDRILFARSQDMQAWASMEALQDVIADDPDGRITLTLVRLWSQYGHYASIYCLNQLGQIVASSEVSLIGRTVAREPWFRHGTKTNGLMVNDLAYDSLTRMLTVRLVVPIVSLHDDQTVIGYLVAHVPHSELNEIIQQVKVHEGAQTATGHVLLADERGRLLAGPSFMVDADPTTEYPSDSLAEVGYVPAGARELSTRGAFLSSSKQMLVGYARSTGHRTYTGLGWMVLVAQDSVEAFGQVKMLRREFGGLFLMTTLLVLVVAYGMSRSISIPIQSLTHLANRIAAGDLSQTIAVQTKDEVGALATSFNRMTEDLRRSRDELVRTNQELVTARDHALEVSRLKSHFLANMSHEIRTPMNGILGMTELILATGLTERQHRLADTVYRSGQALLHIINDILDFSKIEAGKLELEHVDFDLRRVIEETVDMFTERAQRKGLTLSCEIPDTVPAALLGDPGRFRQIVINLLGNAIKFTERGEVGIRVVSLDDSPTQVLLQFTVFDTGIGIPSEAQVNIFEAFSQADSSSTRKYGGTGLGLSIVKQLVELMKGTIEVQSEPGKGARFIFAVWFDKAAAEGADPAEIALPHGIAARVTRPLTETIPESHIPPPVRPSGADHSTPAPVPGGSILLVEDNAVNQEVARLMLEQLGQAVTVAHNGRKALDAVAGGAFDLIFMDCQMPEMDGFAATRTIRERERQQPEETHIPIVALTAHAIHGDHEQCLAAGMDDYLSKPYTQQQLASKLIRWLSPNQRGASTTIHARSEHLHKPAPAPALGLNQTPIPVSVENTNQAVVDRKVWKDISSLQQPGRPDVLITMLSIFLKDSDQVVEQLRGAVQRQDAKAVFELAHSLKSRSGMLGAMKLADLCKKLETSGRAGDLSVAPDQLSELLEEFAGVTDCFHTEVNRRSP